MTSPPAKASVDEKERAILAFWQENGIFQKSVRKNRGKPPFVFFEGPPTANGKPGIHHVLARVYKDIYIRFYNQLGYYVPRRAGWDCHGLPVEREVEKKLGIQTKSEIEERIGLAKFNRMCRESVLEYVRDWNHFSERMGFWIDLQDAYFTMDDAYIESVWSLLKTIHERGLLYRGYKVVPYDTVMGATMSDAEVALGYRTVSDPSLTVRFAIKDSRFADASFLVWTTTPWTLPSNVALALNTDEDYVLCQSKNYRCICAAALARSVLGKDLEILETWKGKDLLGIEYEPLFPWEDPAVVRDAYRTIAGSFVTMDTGTGIVHIAPAYGADDLNVGQENGLPVLHAVGLDGTFQVDLPFRGVFFKDADAAIIKILKEKDCVHRSERFEHEYPFGYRTGSPLIYYAKHAWYIRTTDLREEMIAQNQTIGWIPEHIRAGRFGRWLESNRDWALSRERYWGTPLPVWSDEEGNMVVVGSRAELEALSGQKLKGLDLHRPAIDAIEWKNKNGKTMRRVPEVIDCWFDSGAMPYAQWGYPVRGKDRFEEAFPADFISEAVDQTRGWFYTLLAIGVMISGRAPYRNVICLGHVVDAKGEKMSKSKGNTVAPQEIFEHHGADVLRWYFLTAAPPGQPRRVGRPGESNDPLAVVHGFFNMVRNSCDFLRMYAQVDGLTVASSWQKQAVRGAPAFGHRPAMDRWLLSRTQVLIEEVSRALRSYDSRLAGALLEEFADQLSNWYIRRNRRRFWRGELDADKKAAYDTLFYAIMTLVRLIAPFTPFFAEELFQELLSLCKKKEGKSKAVASVHLLDWPVSQRETLFDETMLREGNLLQKAAGLGRSARTQAGVRVRQPLALLLVHAADREDRQILKQNAEILLEELNVKKIEFLDDSSGILDYRVRPDLKVLGKRLGPRIKALQEELVRRPHRDIVESLRSPLGRIAFELEGRVEEFTAADFLIDSLSRPGIAGAEAPGLLVALDTELTDELKREGLARDVVRQIQESRKQSGLLITDRIILFLHAGGELARALEEFSATLARETLAVIGEKKGQPLLEQTLEIQGEALLLKFWKA
ncbi:MAG: isoleucine--tRNA ligase [Spirochaetales bacterium]|nr:isoleucine--tRNA ligase [Spirochaetales bacterium]